MKGMKENGTQGLNIVKGKQKTGIREKRKNRKKGGREGKV